MEFCKWIVAYDIDGKFYDDGKKRTTVVAIFKDPWQAQEFIDNCLPAQNRERFYVIHEDKLNARP